MLRKFLIAASGFAAIALAGCGGGGGKVSINQPPAPMRLEDQFGAGFGLAFRADRNTEPTESQPVDVEPLSLTTEPREVN